MPKKVVFGLKNVKNFESKIHFLFCREKKNPTNETEKALCTERHFSIETVFLKKYRKKFPKFPKFCYVNFWPIKKTTKNDLPPAPPLGLRRLLRFF